MEICLRLQICQGMIQYLLESTSYSLKNIADLSHAPIRHIRSLYYEDVLPPNITSELNLVNLYRVILELQRDSR